MKKYYDRLAARYGMLILFGLFGLVTTCPLLLCLLIIFTIPRA